MSYDPDRDRPRDERRLRLPGDLEDREEADEGDPGPDTNPGRRTWLWAPAPPAPPARKHWSPAPADAMAVAAMAASCAVRPAMYWRCCTIRLQRVALLDTNTEGDILRVRMLSTSTSHNRCECIVNCTVGRVAATFLFLFLSAAVVVVVVVVVVGASCACSSSFGFFSWFS